MPFFLRSGKSMARRRTEIAVCFRDPPHRLFHVGEGDVIDANVLTFRIQPEEEIALSFGVKVPGAIELRPDYAEAHGWLCATLALSGRDAAAMPACRQAVALDRLGSIPNLLISWPLAGTGRTSEALAQVERALSLEPDVIYALFRRTDLLLRAGRRGDAMDALEQLGRQEGASDPGSLRAVAAAFPGVAPDPRAIAAVRALERETAPGLYYLAALYDWAGSREDALRVVEFAAAARSPWLAVAAVTSGYDNLRTEPRFRAILRGMGLPNGNTAYRSAAH